MGEGGRREKCKEAYKIMKLASSLTVTVRKRDDPRSSCNFCQVTAFTALAEITAPTIYPSQTSTGLTATCSTRSPGGHHGGRCANLLLSIHPKERLCNSYQFCVTFEYVRSTLISFGVFWRITLRQCIL